MTHCFGRLTPEYDPWAGYECPDRAGQLERAPRNRRLPGTPAGRTAGVRARPQASSVRRATADSASIRPGSALSDSIR